MNNGKYIGLDRVGDHRIEAAGPKFAQAGVATSRVSHSDFERPNFEEELSHLAAESRERRDRDYREAQAMAPVLQGVPRPTTEAEARAVLAKLALDPGTPAGAILGGVLGFAAMYGDPVEQIAAMAILKGIGSLGR